MVQAPTALGTCSSEGEGLTGSDVGSGGTGVPFTPLVCRYLPVWPVDTATKNLLLVDFFLIPSFEEFLKCSRWKKYILCISLS